MMATFSPAELMLNHPKSSHFAKPAPQPEFTESPRQPRVLVVDDDADIRNALAMRLSQQGYEVSVAETGRDGLRIARSQPTDLVILDVLLPDTNGMQVCQELTEDSATCCIPVIILSAMTDADIVRKARSAGSCYFVRKPYDPSALLCLIENALRTSQV